MTVKMMPTTVHGEAVLDLTRGGHDHYGTLHVCVSTDSEATHCRVDVTLTELGEYPPHTAREVACATGSVVALDRRNLARLVRIVAESLALDLRGELTPEGDLDRRFWAHNIEANLATLVGMAWGRAAEHHGYPQNG